MTNDSLVSIVNTTVYGRSKKYRLEDTSEVTLVQWAVETKQLLLAHPELAKAKRLLDDSITPEAKDALWSCSKRLAEVTKEYPPGSIALTESIRVKSRLDTPRPGPGDGDKYKGFERTIQKKRCLRY